MGAETMVKKQTGRARRQRGQAIVELALLLPVLAMLLLGGVDLGRAYFSYSAVANATRVGAVYAINNGGTGLDAAEVTKRTEVMKDLIQREAAPQVAVDRARITITNTGDMAPGSNVTIQVQYDFHLLTPLAKILWGDPITFTYVSTIRYA